MAAAIPEAQTQVLEDDVQALFGKPEAGEDEEFVDLAAAAEPAPAAPAAPAKGQEPAAADEDEIPEEYRGKSLKEIARMHREAQQVIGRQGTELGELRKRADQAIQASLEALRRTSQPAPAAAPAAPAEPVKVDESEFFANPQAAVAKAIAASPVIEEIRKTLGAAAQEAAIAKATAATERFNTAHPDAGEIMADPEFQKWVGASRFRQQLLMRAHNNFDFEAGDEVFGTWKALRPKQAAPSPDDAAARAAAQTLAARRKQAAQQAAVPSNGNAAPAQASGSKKIYRRADVLELMERDPERYEQLAPEIEKAYRENRVR